MAANVVEVLVRAKDQASKEIKGITGAIEKNAQAFRRAGLVISGAGAAITGAMGLALKAASDAQASWDGIATLVKNAGLSVDNSVPKIREFASAMQLATGKSDEFIGEIVGTLLPATGDLETAFEATKAALDLTATGMVGMQTAQRLMAQAMDGNIIAVKTYVPGLRELTTEQINNMSKADKQALALKKVQEAFGGLAEKQGKTLQGRMTALSEAFSDLMEVVGDELIPVVTKVTAMLASLVNNVQKAAQENPILTRTVVLLVTALGGLLLVLGPLLVILPSLVAGFKLLAVAKLFAAGAATTLWTALAPIMPIILAISAAVALLMVAWKTNFGGIRDLTKEFAEFYVEKLKIVWEWTKKVTRGLERMFGMQKAEAAVPGGVTPVPFAGQIVPGAFSPIGGGIGGETATAVPPILPTQEQMSMLLEELITTSQGGADEIRAVFEELGFQIDETMLERAIGTRDMFRGIQDGLAEFNASLTQSLGENWDTLQGFMKNFTATTLKVFQQQMSAALSGVIFGTVKAKDAFKLLGEAMIKTIVDFLAQQAVAFAMSKLFAGIAAKVAAVTGQAVAASWATAAAFVSLATLGGNAAPAAAGMATTVAFSHGLAQVGAGVPELAEGGIVDKPTLAVIGERGPEAVVPLDKMMGEQLTVNINMGDVQVRGEEDIRSLTERIVEEIGFLTELRMRRPRTVG